jgi:hypothetical protein
MALLALFAFSGELVMAGEAEVIVVRPNGGGSAVHLEIPGGFGKWHLHFPETMLLDLILLAEYLTVHIHSA